VLPLIPYLRYVANVLQVWHQPQKLVAIQLAFHFQQHKLVDTPALLHQQEQSYALEHYY